MKRSYISPLDFFCDRFDYFPLHVLVFMCMVPTTMVYITAQFKALEATVEIVTGADVASFEETITGIDPSRCCV